MKSKICTCPVCKGTLWSIYEDRIVCKKCHWRYKFATGNEEPVAGPQLASELVHAVAQQEE